MAVPPVAAAVVVAGGLAFGGLAVGALVAAYALAAHLGRRVAPLRPVLRLAPLVALVGALGSVVVTQARTGDPLSLAWPGAFATAHAVTYAAVLALLLLVLADRADDRTGIAQD